MLGGGSRPSQHLHHMLGGGGGREQKRAPLPGSDVRLLLATLSARLARA